MLRIAHPVNYSYLPPCLVPRNIRLGQGVVHGGYNLTRFGRALGSPEPRTITVERFEMGEGDFFFFLIKITFSMLWMWRECCVYTGMPLLFLGVMVGGGCFHMLVMIDCLSLDHLDPLRRSYTQQPPFFFSPHPMTPVFHFCKEFYIGLQRDLFALGAHFESRQI